MVSWNAQWLSMCRMSSRALFVGACGSAVIITRPFRHPGWPCMQVDRQLAAMPRALQGDKSLELSQLCSTLQEKLHAAKEAQGGSVHFAQR